MAFVSFSYILEPGVTTMTDRTLALIEAACWHALALLIVGALLHLYLGA